MVDKNPQSFPVNVPGTRILNGAKWANNSAAEALAHISATQIIFDQSTPGQDSDRWMITNYLDGYKIYNMGSKNWACASRDQVLGVSDFDGETCKWSIEYSGKDQDYWIRVPRAGGPVWTIRPASPQEQTTVFLDPLNEQNANQKVTFVVPA